MSMSTLFSWFTPTVFFLLVQLVIGAIFIISYRHHQGQLPRSSSMLQRLKSINLYSSQEDTPHHNQHTPLLRSPSLIQRLKTINLYTYLPSQSFTHKLTPHSFVPEPTPQQQLLGPDEEDDHFLVQNDNYNLGQSQEGSSLDEIYPNLQQGQEGPFNRTHSDTNPASGEVPVKLPRKMKKSASSKSAFSHFKEEDIVETRRPATVRDPQVTHDDDEVDAKADDFINKFKQQLKLQRLDSIMRYKEIIGRGATK